MSGYMKKMKELLESGCDWIIKRHHSKNMNEWKVNQAGYRLVVLKISAITGYTEKQSEHMIDTYFLKHYDFCDVDNVRRRDGEAV